MSTNGQYSRCKRHFGGHELVAISKYNTLVCMYKYNKLACLVVMAPMTFKRC